VKPDTENIAANRPGILLVDDEPHVLAALRRTLGREPYTVYVAESGDQGLKLLEEHPDIAVVISDYRMPGMDGVEFLQRVKRYSPDIQRVMLTGHADSKAVERAVNESEIHRFLNKPWNTAQLLAMVRECLEHRLLLEENRQYERELAERNRQLEALNRDLERKVDERTRALLQAEKMAALGRMAGGVAHEINNPLGGILAFTQVLLRDEQLATEGAAGEALHTIQECALRCKDIVERMLSFARPDITAEKRLLDLNAVAQGGLAIACLHPRAKKTIIETELHDEPLPVRGIRSALEQVVVNLLQNALKFSPAGSRIFLRTRLREGTAVLEVDDEGPGIAAEDLPHLFEPFFTTAEPGEGTGLGLFVSYGIARDHGGDLQAGNRDGGGASFSMSLPLAAE